MVRPEGPEERASAGLEVAASAVLIDTSAWTRQGHPSVDERLRDLIVRGRAATCGIVELELLFAARGPGQMDASRAERRRNVQTIPIEQADLERAADVMCELAARGKHRSVGIADLLIAACAERAQLTLLHYDSDYDHIAAITGQPTEWVAPRGSMP